MTPSEWKRIRYFGPKENWGDSSLMLFSFVSLLDAFRDFVGFPIVVSKGTQGEHVQTSLHYCGKAADIVFPGKAVSDSFDLFIAASRFDFTEIGIYVGWDYQGNPAAGMHLAFTEHSGNEPARKRYWIGTSEAGTDGTPVRVELSIENLRKFGFLKAV